MKTLLFLALAFNVAAQTVTSTTVPVNTNMVLQGRGTIFFNANLNSLLNATSPYRDVRTFGASGNGVADDTSAFATALAATNSIFVSPGTYMVDKIIVPANKNMLLAEGAIIKARSWPSTNLAFIELKDRASFVGGTIDLNRSVLTTSRGTPTNFNVTKLYALGSTNTTNVRVSGVTTTNSFDEALFFFQTADAIVENSTFIDVEKGPCLVSNLRPTVRNMVVRDSLLNMDAIGQLVTSFYWNTNGVFDGIRIINVGGQFTAFNSTYLSGMLICSDVAGTWRNLTFDGVHPSNTSILACVLFDGGLGLQASGIRTSGWGGGPQMEVNGCINSQFEDVILDGSIIGAGGTPSSTIGLFVRDEGISQMSPQWEIVQLRPRSQSSRNRFINITSINNRTGFENCGSYSHFIGCRAIGNTVNGFRQWDFDVAVSTGIFSQPDYNPLEGNIYDNCVAENNGVFGFTFYGGNNTRWNNCVFRNNSQTLTGTANGFINEKYHQVAIASATTNSITVGSSTFTTSQRNRWATWFSSTNIGEKLLIKSNTATTLYLEGSFTVVPTTNEIVVIDSGGTNNVLINCEFSDTQGWSQPLSGSFDGGAITTLVGLTNITVTTTERIGYGQKIRLKGVATGGSNNDVIAQVVKWSNDIDMVQITPLTLGDGSALSTATLNVPLVTMTGTVTTASQQYIQGSSQIFGNFGILNGTNSLFGYDLDGHVYVKSGSEYSRVWIQLSDTLTYLVTPFTTQVTNAVLQVVKFTVEGIPSQNYGYQLNRSPTTIDFAGARAFGNLSGESSVFLAPGFSVNQLSPITIRANSGNLLTFARTGVNTNSINLDGGRMNWTGQRQFLFSESSTALTDRNAAIGVPGYTNTGLPFLAMQMSASSTAHNIFYGGGNSLGNAATAHFFLGASNITSPTGTALALIQMGTAGAAELYDTPLYLSFWNTSTTNWNAVSRVKRTFGGTMFMGTNVVSDGSPAGFGADIGDFNTTVAFNTPYIIRYVSAIGTNRTVSFTTTQMYSGQRFRIVRTGLGAGTLDVGGLKTIPSATAAWVEVMWNGSTMELIGYGTL